MSFQHRIPPFSISIANRRLDEDWKQNIWPMVLGVSLFLVALIISAILRWHRARRIARHEAQLRSRPKPPPPPSDDDATQESTADDLV